MIFSEFNVKMFMDYKYEGDDMNVQIQFAEVKPIKKKTLFNKACWIVIAIIIVINLIGLYFGNLFYKKITSVSSSKGINQYDKFKETFNEKRYERLYKRDVSLNSKHGYTINGTYIRCDGDSNNTMILLHDLNSSRWSVMKYADIYLTKGFNVLIYDAKGHGESGSTGTTLGYYEKDDLELMVDYISSRNKYGFIGVHGVGLGGFTALLHSELNKEHKKVRFYVIDSSFNDVQTYLTLAAKKDFNLQNSFLVKPLIFYTNIINLYKSKFILSKVTVTEAIKDIRTPMLFIHGKGDPNIPSSMTKALFDAKKDNKLLYLSKSNKHANSYNDNTEEYKKKITDFIDANTK